MQDKCTSKRELTFSQFKWERDVCNRFPRNFQNRFRLSCDDFTYRWSFTLQFEIGPVLGCLMPSALLIWLLANLLVRLTNIPDNRNIQIINLVPENRVQLRIDLVARWFLKKWTNTNWFPFKSTLIHFNDGKISSKRCS